MEIYNKVKVSVFFKYFVLILIRNCSVYFNFSNILINYFKVVIIKMFMKEYRKIDKKGLNVNVNVNL